MEGFWAVLEKVPLAGGGAVGILSVVVYLILTGRLVPRSTLEDVRKDRDERVSEARERESYWRTTADKQQEVISVLGANVGDLLEQGRTTLAIVAALPRPREAHERGVDSA